MCGVPHPIHLPPCSRAELAAVARELVDDVGPGRSPGTAPLPADEEAVSAEAARRDRSRARLSAIVVGPLSRSPDDHDGTLRLRLSCGEETVELRVDAARDPGVATFLLLAAPIADLEPPGVGGVASIVTV